VVAGYKEEMNVDEDGLAVLQVLVAIDFAGLWHGSIDWRYLG
jgi:hypothetical protein